MFNRRFIREKAVQAYYGFIQGGCEDGLVCQKNFLAGLHETCDLYYWQLSFLVALSDYADLQYEEALKRARRSEAELGGLRMMAKNLAIDKLRNDGNLALHAAQYGANAAERTDLVKAVYESLFLNKGDGSVAGRVQSKLDTSEETFVFHKEFLRKIYKKKIAAHPVLRSYCEERSIYWEADYESVCFWVYTVLADMEALTPNTVEDVWNADEEIIRFGKTLLEKTMLHQDEYNDYVAQHSQNWKPERIGATEKTLLTTAIGEMVNFPSIPVKVSLNEYVELSKRLCTPDSSSFVNGLLNKIAEELKAQKIIRKSGRGLIEKK